MLLESADQGDDGVVANTRVGNHHADCLTFEMADGRVHRGRAEHAEVVAENALDLRRHARVIIEHQHAGCAVRFVRFERSEEHPSELQSLMRISYAVICLTKTTATPTISSNSNHTHLVANYSTT